jgi:hypothetical protein
VQNRRLPNTHITRPLSATAASSSRLQPPPLRRRTPSESILTSPVISSQNKAHHLLPTRKLGLGKARRPTNVHDERRPQSDNAERDPKVAVCGGLHHARLRRTRGTLGWPWGGREHSTSSDAGRPRVPVLSSLSSPTLRRISFLHPKLVALVALLLALTHSTSLLLGCVLLLLCLGALLTVSINAAAANESCGGACALRGACKLWRRGGARLPSWRSQCAR